MNYETKNINNLFILTIIVSCCFANIYSTAFNHFNYDKGGEDWNGACKGGNQSPIDITGPFKYKKPTIKFSYSNMLTEYQFLNDGNHLLLEGDFGYVTYDDINYFSSEIRFFAHNNKFPLEVQIYHYDSEGNALVVSMMFKISNDYSIFLGKLGFDNEGLQSQKPFEHRTIKEPVNLSKYIDDQKDFFIYEGKFPTPPCEKNTTFLILTDVMKVTSRQMNNFPVLIKNQNRNIQPKGDRTVFTTFRMKDVRKKLESVEHKIDEEKKEEKKDEEYKLKKKLMNSIKPTIKTINKVSKLKKNKTHKNKLDKSKKVNKNTNSNTANKTISIKNKTLSAKTAEKVKKAPKQKIINKTNSNNSTYSTNSTTATKDGNKTKSNNTNKTSTTTKSNINKTNTNKNTTKSKTESATTTTNSTKLSKEAKTSLIQLNSKSKNTTKNTTKSTKKPPTNSTKKPSTNSTKPTNSTKKNLKKTTKISTKSSTKPKKNSTKSSTKTAKNYAKSSTKKSAKKPAKKSTKKPATKQKQNTKPATKPLTQKQEILKKLFQKDNTGKKACQSDIVPFGLMKLRIKAYSTAKRVNQPQIISGVKNSMDTMPIDNELPKTEKEENRSKILKKYKKLVETYNESGTSDVDKKNILIQIRDMESKLKPFERVPLALSQFDKIDNSINQDVFFSFMQLENKKTKAEKALKELKSDEELDLINEEAKREKIFDSFKGKDTNLNDIKKSMEKIKKTVNKITNKKPINVHIPMFNKIRNKIKHIKNKIFNTNIPKKDKKDIITSNSKYNNIEKLTKSKKYLYQLNNDIDLKLFKMLTFTLNKLVQDLKEIDQKIQTDNKYYSKFLSPLNRVRITHANLAQIIKQIYYIDNNKKLDFEEKLEAIYKVMIKTLKFQHQIFMISNYKDIPLFKDIDIERILNNIYHPYGNTQINKNNFNYGKGGRNGVTNIIKESLSKLPLVICVIAKEGSNINQDELEEDIIMKYTMKDLMKPKVEKTRLQLRFGSRVMDSTKFKALKTFPGQGRRAVNTEGIIAKTEIHSVVPWPDQCKTNINQSPININKPFVIRENPLPIVLNYIRPETNLMMKNDGLKLIFTAEHLGSFSDGNHDYKAKEILIHHPSEHTFGNNEARSVLELQIVHEDKFGNVAVVALFFRITENKNDFLSDLGFGGSNPIYEKKLRNQISVSIESTDKLNIGEDINKIDKFITYEGSLTSPPCTKNVKWFLAVKKLEMTFDQLESFPILFGRETNVRGIFNLGNRKLTFN